MTAVEPRAGDRWVGQALRRKEDPRMITGQGRYVDDIVLPGMLHMAVVRSPEAHARILSIDASGANRSAKVSQSASDPNGSSARRMPSARTNTKPSCDSNSTSVRSGKIAVEANTLILSEGVRSPW